MRMLAPRRHTGRPQRRQECDVQGNSCALGGAKRVTGDPLLDTGQEPGREERCGQASVDSGEAGRKALPSCEVKPSLR